MRCLVFFTFATLALAAPKAYNPRIIGGQEATPHSFPYQALMVMLSEEGRSWYCGGALISQLYVITAAHCVANAAQANVILGAHRYAEEEDSQVLLLGTEITLHENYDSEELINDIALIQLESPVTLSPAIQPIPLPTQDSIDKTYVDALCTATGWGVINSTQTSLSDVLNFVQLRVIENEDCVTYFGPLESSILCTSGLDNRSLCSGDSGGPLVTDGVLIGVGSFVAPNCPNGYPSGFSRVTSFLDWIVANTDIEISSLNNNDQKSRIIGGHEAAPHSLQYQDILFVYTVWGGWFCSGSLVSANYVLTSAYCVIEATEIRVILGAHKFNEKEDTQVVLNPSEYIIHEDYDPDQVLNDIAIIKLPSSVNMTSAIQPIPLPSKADVNKDYTGFPSTASGWGYLDNNMTYGTLNFAELTVITNVECQSFYGEFVQPSHLCSSGANAVSVCAGDYGGPLVSDGVLIGVAVFSGPDCNATYPSGFSRITSFFDWIIANTDL